MACLLFTACKEPEVTSYRVPKEEPAQAPMMPPANGVNSAEAMRNAELPGMTRPDSPMWEAPAHWTAKDPGSVRVGSWDIVDGDATVDASVTAFPGDVGGDAANINRWRGQVGLSPATDEAVEQLISTNAFEVDGSPAYHVLMKSDTQAIAGVIIKRADRTWFIKLMGDAALTESEHENMLRFAESFDFPE